MTEKWPFTEHDEISGCEVKYGSQRKKGKMRDMRMREQYIALVIDGYFRAEKVYTTLGEHIARDTTAWNETNHPFIRGRDTDYRRFRAVPLGSLEGFVSKFPDNWEYERHDGDLRFQAYPHAVCGVLEVATK